MQHVSLVPAGLLAEPRARRDDLIAELLAEANIEAAYLAAERAALITESEHGDPATPRCRTLCRPHGPRCHGRADGGGTVFLLPGSVLVVRGERAQGLAVRAVPSARAFGPRPMAGDANMKGGP